MGLDQYFMDADAPEDAKPRLRLRKVNCIQGWMDVHNGSPLDNCEEIELGKEDIGQLLDDIFDAVYRGGDKLEPTPGFFFGSYDKGPDYWFTLGCTYEQLRDMYNSMDDSETLKYHGWW